MPTDAYYIASVLQAHWVTSGSKIHQGLVSLAVWSNVEVGSHMCATEFDGHKKGPAIHRGARFQYQAWVTDRWSYSGKMA